MDSKIILGRILQELIRQGYSQYGDYNKFIYLTHSNDAVFLRREKETEARVDFHRLIVAIEAYQAFSDAYDEGPTRLRDFGLTHITSPIHSLLHLLDRTVYRD